MMRLKGSPYLGMDCDRGDVSAVREPKICELTKPRDHQRRPHMVLDLLKLKCAPCQAEKEKTAFTGDGDGRMSSIISGEVFRFRVCWAWHSRGCAPDILVLPCRCSSLDVSVVGATFLQPCRFKSGFTNQAYSNGNSHSWDHHECTV